jgi:hypothetical protein
MKMSHVELKALIKECIVEVLNDGIGTLVDVHEARRRRVVTNADQHQRRQTNVKPSLALREAVKRESRGSSVLADILSDTASKTLPNMLTGETNAYAANGGLAEQIVANTEPDKLFGEESAAKWASLAFTDAQKRQN